MEQKDLAKWTDGGIRAHFLFPFGLLRHLGALRLPVRDGRGRNGASHFIEHMAFKGTERLSAMDIAVKTDLFGGQVNAYTTKEYTCFYAHTLSTHAPEAFEMLCDMVAIPALTKRT